MLLPSVFSSFRRLGVTFRNARPVEIVGEFLFYTGGHLFGMKSNHTAPRENEVRGHIPAPYDSFFNLFESSRHAVKVSHGLLHCTPAPITSSFSCIQEFESGVRSCSNFPYQLCAHALIEKSRTLFSLYAGSHTTSSFPAPFSKLFLRYVVLVTATDFTKPWITVQ